MTLRRLLPLILVIAGVLRAGDALACSVHEGDASSWIDGADIIVRAQIGRAHV